MGSSGIELPPGKVMNMLQELVADGRNRVDQSQKPWIIVEVASERTLYYFIGNTNEPAFPSVYIRKPVEKDGSISIQTRVICESAKEECDKWLVEFQKMDEQIKQRMQRQ